MFSISDSASDSTFDHQAVKTFNVEASCNGLRNSIARLNYSSQFLLSWIVYWQMLCCTLKRSSRRYKIIKTGMERQNTERRLCRHT